MGLRHHAERVRRDRSGLDGAAVRAVLTLGRVLGAAFRVAGGLYGQRFAPRADLPVWRPGVRAWAATGADGLHTGLRYTDFAARPEKHGGVWMGLLHVQEAVDGPVNPTAYIVTNSAVDEREDAGLSIDEARTLFHELGHALRSSGRDDTDEVERTA